MFSLHLAYAVNRLLHTLFQRDIAHSQNNAAESRYNKWDVVHRNLVDLHALLFGGRVVDRFEDSDQLVMDERARADDDATICRAWLFLSKRVVRRHWHLRRLRKQRTMARIWASARSVASTQWNEVCWGIVSGSCDMKRRKYWVDALRLLGESTC